MILNKIRDAPSLKGDSDSLIKAYYQLVSGNPGDTGTVILADFEAINTSGSNTKMIAVKAAGDIQLATPGNKVRFPDGTSFGSGDSAYLQVDASNYAALSGKINSLPVSDSAISALFANYITNGTFKADTSGWVSSAGFVLARQSVVLLNGTGTGMISKDSNNRAGNVIYYPYNADPSEKNQVEQITFNYFGDSIFINNGSINIYIYDVANSDTIFPAITQLPGGAGRFLTKFIASSSTSYRLQFVCTTATTTAFNYYIDNVTLGPETKYYSVPISGWTDYIPTLSTGAYGTNTLISKWRRVGSNMEITYSLNQTSAGTAGSGNYLLTIPSGYTIDTSKITLDDGANIMGTVFGSGQVWLNGSPSYMGNVGVRAYSSTQLVFTILIVSNTNLTDLGYWTSGHFQLSNSNIRMDFTCSIPISQWSTNVNLITDFTEYSSNSSSTDADDTTSFTNGSQGAAGIIATTTLTAPRKKRIQFTRPIQATDLIVIEFYDPTSGMWSAMDIFKSAGGICNHYIYFDSNGGMGLTGINSTQVDVIFENRPSGVASVAWNNAAFAGMKWRVRKTSNGNFAESIKQVNPVNDANLSTTLVVNTSTNTAGVWSAAVTMTGVPTGATAAWCVCCVNQVGATPSLAVEAATGYTLSDITIGTNIYKYWSVLAAVAGEWGWRVLKIHLDSNGQFKWCTSITSSTVTIGSAVDWEY